MTNGIAGCNDLQDEDTVTFTNVFSAHPLKEAVLLLRVIFLIGFYLFGNQSNRKRETKNFSTCWVLPQMTTTAEAELSQSQGVRPPRLVSRELTW